MAHYGAYVTEDVRSGKAHTWWCSNRMVPRFLLLFQAFLLFIVMRVDRKLYYELFLALLRAMHCMEASCREVTISRVVYCFRNNVELSLRYAL